MQFIILNLLKIYDDEQYADQFMRGRLRLQRLSQFKRQESGIVANAGRADPNEAVAVWLQKASVEFKEHPELNISPTDLAKAITISFEYDSDFHLFCMTALHTGRFECENGLISLAENEVDECKMQLESDEDKFEQEFGKIAVFVQPVEFVLRVRKAVERRGYTCNSTLVEYIDSETFDGRVPLQFVPFRKELKYSWQKEYRIAVDTKTKGDEPLFLEIGDICDIAAKMPTRDINSARKMEFRSA